MGFTYTHSDAPAIRRIADVAAATESPVVDSSICRSSSSSNNSNSSSSSSRGTYLVLVTEMVMTVMVGVAIILHRGIHLR